MSLKTNVYIDGFNLYYGCLRNTDYKWLNVAELCNKLMPNNNINRIRYFTAPVIPRASDPQQGQRQQTYLRALRTIPNLSIITGHFLSSTPWMMKADLSGKVQVLKTEEKGSDVNLASYILTDAYESDYDIAAVISNDSDLVYPIDFVKRKLGKVVGMINPYQKPSRELRSIASFYKQIRQGVLSVCQFPSQMTDSSGVFHKPPAW